MTRRGIQLAVAGFAFVLVLMLLFVPRTRPLSDVEGTVYSCPGILSPVFSDSQTAGIPVSLYEAAVRRVPLPLREQEVGAAYVAEFQWQSDKLIATCDAERDGRLALLLLTCAAAITAVLIVGRRTGGVVR